ncbi:MAG: ERCC4 domain-containing protein [Candidatus Dormibacteria bacterium]
MADPEDGSGCNPGARVPRGRATGPLVVAVDTREKYGWKFAGRPVTTERRALPGGDYAAVVDGSVIAVVERKTLENLATSLSDGSLAFQMQRLAEVGHAVVVVDALWGAPHKASNGASPVMWSGPQ